MDPVSNYKLQCQQAEAMVQDYYNGLPPFKGNPACIPTVPCDNEGNSLVNERDIPFRYVEINFSDGRNVLAIETPFDVENGPGVKYRVRPVMDK